jgi:methionyl-tRNA synthetase
MNKHFFITTAIDYPSSRPHLGHAYEKIIADVIARWKKVNGFDVFFTTGLDCHGLKIQKAAEQAGLTAEEFVNNISKFFKELCEILNISYNDFIFTTEKRHEDLVKKLLMKLYENGDIYKGDYEGLYCVDCETFYTEKDLIEDKCPIHKKEVILKKEEGYFFRLSKYQERVINHMNNKDSVIPEKKRNEMINRLKEPLKDVCISRDVKWGIPLPFDETLVSWVWIEALMNYLTVIDYPNEKFKIFWPAMHLIGPDIVWHHTILWDSILLSLGIDLPKVIVHGFINIEGEKMSKSGGIVIDPIELAKKYGTDSLRYFLLREIPFGENGNYFEKALIQRINSELADSLGNLVNRILVLVEKNFDGYVPKPYGEDLKKLALSASKAVENSMEEFQFHNALNDIFYLVNESNKYINEKKPWEIRDRKELGGILYNLLETLRFIAILLFPFTPETSGKIFEQLGLERRFSFEDLEWGKLKPETKIKRGKILFEKIKL